MRLQKLLEQLDNQGLEKARLFLKSPYFNKNNDLLLCFNLIVGYISDKKVFDKTQIWDKMYSKEAYNDLKLRKLFHDLTQKLQLFFATENMLQDEFHSLKMQIDFSKKNYIKELRNKYIKELGQKIKQTDLPSSALFDLYFSIRDVGDLLEDDLARLRAIKKEDNIFDDIDLLQQTLKTAYYTERVRLFLIRNNHSEMRGDRYSAIQEDLEKIIQEATDHQGIIQNDLLDIYIKTYQLITHQTEHYDIHNIINLLGGINPQFHDEVKSIYTFLSNFLTRQINIGKKVYDQTFTLFNFGLDQQLLISKDQIDVPNYLNIVIVACRIKEFDWALSFVEEYRDYLAAEYRQSAYSFSKARIFNNMGNHDEVINVLLNVEYEDVTYNLNSRIMLIMAFYELDEFETLDSTIKAFQVFLRRHRNLSTRRKNNFRDFCDVVYNLVKSTERKDKERVYKAINVLEGNPGIPSSWWLKEKVQEVKDILKIKDDVIHSPTT